MYLFGYFPYFPSDNADIKVNRLHLFNFWKYKDQYISSPEIRDRIQKFCELYVYSQQRILQTMTIAVIDDTYDFAPLTEPQMADVGKYASAMLLCSVGKNSDNCGNFHSCCISEQFNNYFQEFDLTTDLMTYSSGSYVRHTNMAAQIHKTKFVRPEYIDSVSSHRARPSQSRLRSKSKELRSTRFRCGRSTRSNTRSCSTSSARPVAGGC